MKHVLLIIVLMGVLSVSRATTYYSQVTGSPTLLSNWNSNRSGGGTTPAGFITPGDIFIIQGGHVITTTQAWTIGAAGSSLIIENGGYLHGAHAILLTGSFQMNDGSVYYHDNTASVSSAAGASIFGGSESFSAGSTIEIRNWVNSSTTLPSGVNWGHLVLNYNSVGGNWNQSGALTTIQGNFIVKKTGATGEDFRLTSNSNISVTVGGNLEVESAGNLFIKDGANAGTNVVLQVNGDITVNNGQLNLGTADFKPNNELRVKGNVLVVGTGVITASNEQPFLVFNSTSVQSLYTETTLLTGLKVAKGAMLKLNSTLGLGSLRPLVVAGTLAAGVYPINMGGGEFVVSGGYFTSSSKISMQDGYCQSCQGNGTFSFSTNWCATTGDTGIIQFDTDTILFNRSLASSLKIGALNSKGKMFFSNSATIAFTGTATGPAPNRGNVELTGNGTLSLDEFSKVSGDAFYNGNGGLLMIGSASGLVTAGNFGNFQITGARNYNNSGVNSYEYKSSQPQFTGAGLPSTISGALRINNSHPQGVTLSKATTIASGARFRLENGLLQTNSGLLLTLNRGSIQEGGSSLSYVNGPLRKFGETAFTFHVGKSGRYSPVSLNPNGNGQTTDNHMVEYFPGNPQSVYGNQLFQLIEHISSVEYWLITGSATFRKVRLPITPYSGVNHFPSLVVSYYDGGGWINLGNGTVSGTTSNGTIEVDALNFGPLTFGSTDISTNAMMSSLPVQFSNFTVRKDRQLAVLDWTVDGQMDAQYFEVEVSSDNRHFTRLATIPAAASNFTYQYQDARAKSGVLYYRIRVVEHTGLVSYSRIAALVFDGKALSIVNATPSVVKSSTQLQVVSSDAGAGMLTLSDANGRILRQFPVMLAGNTQMVSLDMSSYGSGLYFVNILAGQNRSNTIRLYKN